MKNITAALIKFQGEVGTVAKNSDNPYFKSRYGDLNAYLEVIKKPLADCGLAIAQLPITNGLKTILLHESGETIESEMTIPNLPADPQKVGAALTYMRRYMIAAMLMLNAEDDDANSVSQPPKKIQIQPTKLELKKQAIDLFQKVVEPTESLRVWIAQLDAHPESEILSGIKGLKNILQGK